MAKPVKVALLGDTSNLKSSFAEATSIVDGFSAKTVAIGTAIGDAISAIVGKLVDMGKQAATTLPALGAEFQSAYNQIRVSTGATGDVLASFQDAVRDIYKQTPASLDDASRAVSMVFQRLGLVGKPLEEMALQLLQLSRITGTDLASNLDNVTSILNDWGVAAADQPALINEMFRAFQASGVPVDRLTADLAGNAGALKQLGFSSEKAIALTASLGKSGISLSEIMQPLRKELGAAAKAGKDGSVAFQEWFDVIKRAPTDTAAMEYAIQRFGERAGPKLAILIREGKLSYQDLLAQIQLGGDTIGQAARDTSTWQTKWAVFIHKLQLAFEPAAKAIVDWLDDIVRRFSSWFGDLKAAYDQGGWAGVWEKIKADLGRAWDESIKPALDKVPGQVAQWVNETGMPAIKDAVGGLKDGFLSWLDNLWGGGEGGKGGGEEKAGGFLSGVLGWVNEHTKDLDKTFKGWADAAIAWVDSASKDAIPELDKFLDKITKWLENDENKAKMQEAFSTLMAAAAIGAVYALPQINAIIAATLLQAGQEFGKAGAQWAYELGKTFIGGIVDLIDKLPAPVKMFLGLEGIVSQIKKLQETPVSEGGWKWPEAQPRAMGGPVFSGSPYLVGERGPELFVPKGNGTIIPNGAGGATYNISGTTTDQALQLIVAHERMALAGAA